MQKTTSLETELKDTKKTLGTAIITLVGRVKKLEGALKKRKREPIILYDLFQKSDPDAKHKMCLKYASDEEDDSDSDTLVPFYAVVDWELLPTGLGTINVIYRKDNSLKYFTSLREILHLVTREDLMTIYGRVVTYYQDKEADGVGLILWGDLRVLIDSPEVDDGSEFWKSQHKWRIQSWKLYAFLFYFMLADNADKTILLDPIVSRLFNKVKWNGLMMTYYCLMSPAQAVLDAQGYISVLDGAE
ncbi:hypothetical protein Tco_1568928 [Tanacetum coccineum]